MKDTNIPKGYRQNSIGHLVHEDSIPQIDLDRDKLVTDLVGKAKKANGLMTKFKGNVQAEIDVFLAKSAKLSKSKVSKRKGNVTLYNFDSSMKIQITVSERIAFDERLQSAKTLIDECIMEFSKDSSPEVKTLIQGAFELDKQGNVSVGRVLALRRLNIKHKKWELAMEAIGSSLQIVGSNRYIRFYERVGDSEKYQHINLDFAAS